MSQLTIEGFEVEVSQTGAEIDEAPWGDFGRAFSGRMRSDVRAHHDGLRIRTAELTVADAEALRLILKSPGPLSCTGELVGTAARDFHAAGVRVTPVTGTHRIVEFDLRATRDNSEAELLFSFDGDAEGPYTFTRTGTAYYIDSDGVLQSAAEDEARFSWPLVDGVRTPSLLLEAARTNLITSDDLTAWDTTGTPVVTGSQSDPAGGTGAYTVEDNDGSGVEYPRRDVSFTGNGVKSVVFVVRENTMPGAGAQSLRLVDSTAVANRLDLVINGWTDGEPSVTAANGTLLGKQELANGYWAIYGQSDSVTAANTNRVQIRPAATSSATGSIDVYRVNAFNATVPPTMPLDASGVLGAETLYTPFVHAPQAMTVYVKFIERGTIETSLGGIFHIGAADGTTDPRFQLKEASGAYNILHDNGGEQSTATLAAAPSIGDVVELRAVLNADGSVTLGQSIDGATEATASDATTATLQSAWAGTRLYIGSRGSSLQGLADFPSIKVAAGTKTLSEMRALSAARLHPRTR